MTDDYPIWVKDFGWLDSINLVPGLEVERRDGKTLTVIDFKYLNKVETTYNLEVSDWHTYYVGDAGLLVHNCDEEKPDTLKPGNYANESISARGPKRNFTKAEREKINEIGSKSGCHSCGNKDPGTKSGNHIPDHQPPNALNDGGPQKLFPHCKNCSARQGGQVSAEIRKNR